MRTVGVEEELLLVAPDGGSAMAVAAEALGHADALGLRRTPGDEPGGVIEHEMTRQQLEVDTRPRAALDALEEEVRALRARAATVARAAGAEVAALATFPLPAQPLVVAKPRYEAMAARFGETAREYLACGCHVHVGVTDREEAVGVLDRVRGWLPPLLALSANSPYWQGRDTDYHSFRSQLMGRWPSAGPPDLYGSAAAYDAAVTAMIGSGVLLDPGMVYFDARPSHRYPTLEVRVADVCLDPEDTVLVAGLVRALVETAAQAWARHEPAPTTPTAFLRLQDWQAARDGLAADLVDPRTGRPAPAAEVLAALVAHVAPALEASGDTDLVHRGLDRVLGRGSGATRQREVLARTGSLAGVVRDAVAVTTG